MEWNLIFLDVLVFFILVFLFWALKGYRTRHVKLENRFVKRAVFCESESIGVLVKQVWNARIEDVIRVCGKEAAIYLSLHKKIGIALLGMTLVGFPVMLPVYMDGHIKMIYWSVSTIIHSDSSMIVFIVFLVLFSLVCYYLAYSVCTSGFNTAETPIDKIQMFSLEIEGVNTVLTPEEAKKSLEATFATQFPARVSSVYVVPDYTESYKALMKIKTNKRKLEHYENIQAMGQKPMMYVNFCKKIDAIEHYVKKLEDLDERYEIGLKYGKEWNTGFAYVICNSVDDAEFVLKHIWRYSSRFLEGVKEAPALEEIKWENMDEVYLVSKTKKVCIFIGIFLVYFFLFTPAHFGAYISEGLKNIGLYTQKAPLFRAIIILLYQNFVLRFSIRYLVKKEKNTNMTSDIVSSMVKYLIFMGFYVFIYPILGLEAVSIISLSIQGDTDTWRELFAKAVLESGLFYTVLILQQAFIVNGFDLLQVPVIFRTILKLWRASSPREKELAYEAQEFDFPYELSRALTTLMIILCFSVTYPLILPIGFFYFLLRYWISKYLILCTFHCNNYVTAARIPSLCVRSILTSVFLFQFISSYILILSLSISLVSLGSIFTVLSIILFITLQMRVTPILKQYSTSPQEPLLRPTSTYLHPVECLTP